MTEEAMWKLLWIIGYIVEENYGLMHLEALEKKDRRTLQTTMAYLGVEQNF